MKRTKLLPLLLSALLLLSASGCRPAEAPSQSGGASSSVSSSTSSSGIPAPNDEVLPIDLAVLSGPTGVGAAYLMEYYAPEHVPADSPISVSSVVVTENSEATALLSNGEADIAAVATNVASNFYHKTDGVHPGAGSEHPGRAVHPGEGGLRPVHGRPGGARPSTPPARGPTRSTSSTIC